MTTKLWNFLSVASYALVKLTVSSSLLSAWLRASAIWVNLSPRSSQRRPSVAVRFFSPFSLSTSASSVADWVGAARKRVRIFCWVVGRDVGWKRGEGQRAVV